MRRAWAFGCHRDLAARVAERMRPEFNDHERRQNADLETALIDLDNKIRLAEERRDPLGPTPRRIRLDNMLRQIMIERRADPFGPAEPFRRAEAVACWARDNRTPGFDAAPGSGTTATFAALRAR